MATDNEACRRTREDLSSSWPLPPAPGAESRAHLESCADCRAELNELTALAARSETKPWASLLRRTPRPEWQAPPKPAVSPRVWAPAAALAAFAAFAVWQGRRGEPEALVAIVPPAPAPVAPAPAPIPEPIKETPAVVERPKRRKTVIVAGPKPEAPAKPAPAPVPAAPADAPAEMLENLALIENLELLENLEDAEAMAEDNP